MELHIKILGGKEIFLSVEDNASISDVKGAIEKAHNIPSNQQKLVFKGKTLSNEKRLEDYGITDFSKLHLVVKKTETKNEPITVLNTPSKYTSEDFWVTLEKVLLKQYDQVEVQRIVQQYRQDYKRMLTTMSLDDIERLATRYLNS